MKCRYLLHTTQYTITCTLYTYQFIINIATQHQHTRYPLQDDDDDDDDHDRIVLRILIVVIMIFICRFHTHLICSDCTYAQSIVQSVFGPFFLLVFQQVSSFSLLQNQNANVHFFRIFRVSTYKVSNVLILKTIQYLNVYFSVAGINYRI